MVAFFFLLWLLIKLELAIKNIFWLPYNGRKIYLSYTIKKSIQAVNKYVRYQPNMIQRFKAIKGKYSLDFCRIYLVSKNQRRVTVWHKDKRKINSYPRKWSLRVGQVLMHVPVSWPSLALTSIFPNSVCSMYTFLFMFYASSPLELWFYQSHFKYILYYNSISLFPQDQFPSIKYTSINHLPQFLGIISDKNLILVLRDLTA